MSAPNIPEGLKAAALDAWLNDGSANTFIIAVVEAYLRGRQAGLQEAEAICRDRIGAYLEPFERNAGANFALSAAAEAIAERRF